MIGYFANPGYKDVPNLADVGYPIAEVMGVDSLGLNGPSGGSIASMGVREVLRVMSTFVPRDLIRPTVTVETGRV